MKKKLISLVTAVLMAVSMLTASALAIDIDKTAESTLDENNQTTVTLNVGGTQDVENVAVLFVLDYSTSVDVRNAAASFVDELATKENTNVKACVINYWADADTGTWTTIDSETEASSLLAQPSNKSGTNYHAGLLAAQEALKSDDITGYTTYLVTISDGITYLWTDDDTSSDTYGQTMSVWYQNNGNGASDIQNGNSVYEMKYGSGNAIPNDQFTALVNGTDETLTKYADTIVKAEPYATSTKPSTDETDRFFSYLDNATKESVKENYLIGSEIAIYKTASVYKQLVNTVDYAYAFKLDENHWSSYPYGEQLMDYLASLSAKPSGEITATSAADTFANVSDQILYEIMKGTVTDVIGEDFDWVGMDTVKLTVGGTKLTGTVDGNTVSFDGGKYVVTYHAATENTDEYFTWEIKTPVEAANGLTLSYDLALRADYEVPEHQTVVLDTNESAVIEYEDPDGEDKKEEFPVPQVVIGGEKVNEPGMDKTIVVTDEEGNKTEVDQDDVAAGDTVDFALDSTIPDALKEHITFTYGENGNVVGTVNSTTESGVDTYYLTFHDVMDDGLTLTENSIAVTINGETLDSEYYTVTTGTENSDGCTFEVSVELLKLYTDGIISYSDIGAATITVTYSAKLSDTAAAGTYNNKAWVVYNGNKSKEDKVEVDTYGIQVFKYDQDGAVYAEDGTTVTSATGLEGAVFTLTYPDGTTEECTTDKDGYISLDGLDAGTYYLVETKAPSGYVASGDSITVTVDADNTTANVAYVYVANAAIPSTGGAGTTMYTVAGICIIMAAGLALVVTHKKREA